MNDFLPNESEASHINYKHQKSKDNKLERIHRIANNAIYFDDSSDFATALWEILSEFDKEAEFPSDLEYIEDEQT